MRLTWIPFYISVLFPFTVHSTEVHYGLGVTLTHYDNINLEPAPVDSEFSEALRGSVSIIENTSNLVANLDAVLETIRYNNEQVSDQNIGQLITNALWVISPSHLEWYLSDTYTQTAIDSLSSYSPGNRQDVNAFTTGPNYYWRLNPRNNIALEARVEDYEYENVDIDNQRLTGAVRWFYDVNSSLSTALNVEAETVNFTNDTLNSNFDRNDIYISLNYIRGLTNIEIEAGKTNVSNDLTDDIDESRFLFALENARTRTSTLRLEYERMVSDTSSELASLQVQDLNSQEIASVSSDTFISKTSRVIFEKILNSGTFSIGAYKGGDDYVQQDEFDQKDKGIDIAYTWQIHERSQIILEAQGRNNVYENSLPFREDDDLLYHVGFEYFARRNVNLNIDVYSQERDSTVLIENYEDLRIALTLEYLSR